MIKLVYKNYEDCYLRSNVIRVRCRSENFSKIFFCSSDKISLNDPLRKRSQFC